MWNAVLQPCLQTYLTKLEILSELEMPFDRPVVKILAGPVSILPNRFSTMNLAVYLSILTLLSENDLDSDGPTVLL